jgi:PAS domain S-box-containing protein
MSETVREPAHRVLAHSPPDVRLLVAVLLTAAGYYSGAYLSILLRAPPAGISTIWPPNAILLAALLLTSPRKWWWFLLAVLPAHLHVVATFQQNVPLVVNFIQYVGNIGQALIAAFALRKLTSSPPRFDNVREMSWYMLIAALVAPAIATTVVAYLFVITGWTTDYWLTWQRRLLTNSIPALALTPLIIIAVTSGWSAVRRIPLQKWAEFGVLTVSLFVVGMTVFGWEAQGNQALPLLLYAVLPLLLWAAVRFGFAALFVCILVMASLSLAQNYAGRGPFLTLAGAQDLLSLQVFLIASSVPLLLLSAVVKERQRAEQALRISQQRHQMASAAGSVGVWDWDLTTGRIYTDPVIKAMLGYEVSQVDDSFSGWAANVHPDDLEESNALARAHIEGTTPVFESEQRMFHKDGTIRWFLARGVVVERVGGVPTRMMGTTTDITQRRLSEEVVRISTERIRELAGRLITGQEEERRRIARDLHDDLNQKVAALSIAISNVRDQLPASAEPFDRNLLQLRAMTNELADDIRELSHEIHPATLENAGLVTALTSYASEIRRLEGVTVELTLPASQVLVPREVAICVYRVAQESIRNVVRHSGTKGAQLTLTVSKDGVTLLVKDQGRGFDGRIIDKNGGLGLISIQERVRLLNGHVEITSQPGRGTTIKARVPVQRVASIMAGS